MEKKDYISKLFLNNQDKLEQQPSEGLWDRIESNLDESMPVEKSRWSLIGLYRISAAAAVIGLTLSIFLIYENLDDQPTVNMVLDEALAQVSDEAEPYEDEEVLPKSIAELDEKLAISKQEKKIIEAVRTEFLRSETEKTDKKKKIEFKDIELNDNYNEIADESIIMIEPEPSMDQAIEEAEIADFYQNNEKIQSTNLNYAISSPQLNSRSTISNIGSIDQDNNYGNKVSSSVIGNDKGMDNKQLSSNSSIVYSKDSRNKGAKTQKNNLNLHPKLRAFEFLMGSWIDKHEYDGQSFESWELVNRNRLSGIGTKKSNKGDILFEEKFFLEIKHNKVFLILTFAENGNKIEYMLSKASNERFIFLQNEKTGYPDKVILQKMMDGYTLIINNSIAAMSVDQQRFLENRNRVTNNASKRILSKYTSGN